MKRVYFIIICITVLLTALYSQSYPLYDMELIKTFNSGEGNEELKNMTNVPVGGPTALAFDKDGFLYISDILNSRVVKYDKNIRYVQEYKDCYAAGAGQLFINDDGEFISYKEKIISIDTKNGDMKASVNFYDSSYKDKLPPSSTFIYKNGTVYTYLKDDSLISIPNPGIDNKLNMDKILDEKQTLEMLNKKTSNDLKTVTFDIKDNSKVIEKSLIVQDIKNNKGDTLELETQNFEDFYQFHKVVNTDKSKMEETDKVYLKTLTNEYIEKNLSNIIYLGKDKDNNSYWWGAGIYVFNNTGKVIEAFKYDSKRSKVYPAIHPSGDVYFLNYDGEKNYLYRIKRVW